ncbi:Gfo/Idh/MocA family protein [Streptomyces sp. NPDC056987]|uniref:Gfo/Idh/MocA family protein n=1 Tax=Streptomyces sp. NPDC056987 TaxID=3345988 RepID=UPI003642B54B
MSHPVPPPLASLPPGPLPVVLAGARGHGRTHLVNIHRLEQAGLVRLVGICELTPLSAEELAGFGTPEQSDDFAGLLKRTGARVAVVCTPIHTHTELALTAADHGVHTLLEKPTTPSYAEFERLLAGLAERGTACQVGFQSLGSGAVDAIRRLVADGAIGTVRGIGAAGAWVRDDAYYRRVPWAGRRSLNGRDVVDGVLTNPLAHAVATALRLDGSERAEDIAGIELEQFRANDIEADDTSCLRVRTARGTRITVAVTLCAERAGEPYVVVHGSRGRITFWYKQDRVLVERADGGTHDDDGAADGSGASGTSPAGTDPVGTSPAGTDPAGTVHGRTDLLENLVAHLRDGTELLVPAPRTGAFMRIVEAIRTGPPPTPLPAGAWHTVPGEKAPRRVVRGIDALVAASADTLSTFSELGAGWAAPPTEVHPR